MCFIKGILMAKVVVEVDTDAGTMDVSVNGKKVDTPQYFSSYMSKDYEGKAYAGFSIETVKKEDGVTTRQMVCAKKSKEGELSMSLGGVDSDIPECVVDVTKASVREIDQNIKSSVKKFLRAAL